MKDFLTEQSDEYLNNITESKGIPNPHNPFDNFTENSEYNESYTDIVPEIQLEGYRLPDIPSKSESSRIKHFYNSAGIGIIIHFALSFIIANMLNFIAAAVIMLLNDVTFSEFMNDKGAVIQQYIDTSSISPAITLLSYLTANLAAFLIGLKMAGIKLNSLFKTSELTFFKVIQYCLIAIFLQFLVGKVINFLQIVMTGADVLGTSTSLTTYYSTKYAVLSIIYTCVVGPITEELFYRGFVLKSFSRVSQRFGIILSALFFGLSHGNIAQFVLAFIVGIFMGYIDIKHNSVLPSIIAHIAVNSLATLSAFAGNFCTTNQFVLNILNYAAIAMAVAGLVMFIIFCCKSVFPRMDIRQQFRCGNIAAKSVAVVISAIMYTVLTLYITFR
ncbi:MAG: CPBP family intramembrane metalloprotease [Oscillospiraceae bacterium]|nr:CPBP family intramembrane metalloprotease [Oscillospiraceae bacterium]